MWDPNIRQIDMPFAPLKLILLCGDANSNTGTKRNTHEQKESSHTVDMLCHQNFGPISKEKVNFENPLHDVEIIDALPLEK